MILLKVLQNWKVEISVFRVFGVHSNIFVFPSKVYLCCKNIMQHNNLTIVLDYLKRKGE